MRNKNWLVLYGVVMFIAFGCKSNENNPKVGQTIDVFYDKIAHKDYEGAYGFFADGFRQKVSKNDFITLFEQTNKIYGNYKSREQIGWEIKQQLNSGNNSKIYNYHFKAYYDSKITNEDIIIIESNGVIKFARYDVTPLN